MLMWNNQLMHCLGEHQHWSSFLATTVFLTNAVLAAVVRMMRVTGFWSRSPLHFRPPSSPSSRSFIKFGALAIINIVPWKARPLDLAVEHGILRATNLALLQFWPQLSWLMSLLPSVILLVLLEKIANMWVPSSS